jgi:hypothetical protein
MQLTTPAVTSHARSRHLSTHRALTRVLAFIAYFSSLPAAFAGSEPPIYYDTPQAAAEAISHWTGQLFPFEFTAMDSPPHISPFYPSRVEHANVALTEGRFAVIFARGASVVVHGGSVKIALFALLVREQRGWRLQGFPARFQAYGDDPNVTFALQDPARELTVTVDARDGQRVQRYTLTDGKLHEVKR